MQKIIYKIKSLRIMNKCEFNTDYECILIFFASMWFFYGYKKQHLKYLLISERNLEIFFFNIISYLQIRLRLFDSYQNDSQDCFSLEYLFVLRRDFNPVKAKDERKGVRVYLGSDVGEGRYTTFSTWNIFLIPYLIWFLTVSV